VNRRLIAHCLLFAAPLAIGLSGCSSTGFSFSKKSDNGLTNVDELLTRIEKVQVESLVAKERARAAYDTLRQTVAPEFDGDAVEQYKLLVDAIDESKKQSKTLGDSVPPLKHSATIVFERWTKDLEEFGNTRMRQRSQERLEATRTQYETILRQTVAAQLSLDALNADLNDHALFLGHDFNSESASAIASDVKELESRVAELDSRLDASIASSKQYIASRALRGEVKGEEEQVEEERPKAAAKAARRKARQQQADADGASTAGGAGAAAAEGGRSN